MFSVPSEHPSLETRHQDHHGPPHEIAHAGFISEDDYGRLSELNITAEMSPALWPIPEFGLQRGFRFKTILSHGAEMTRGIRLDHHGPIDLATHLEAMTIAGARAVGRDTQQRLLGNRQIADLIVLDRNLLEVPAEEIGGTRVLRTVFEGDTVYRDNVSHHP